MCKDCRCYLLHSYTPKQNSLVAAVLWFQMHLEQTLQVLTVQVHTLLIKIAPTCAKL